MRKLTYFITTLLMLMIIGSISAQDFPDSLATDMFEELSSNYYLSHPIPTDISSPKNLHYRIKVGSFSQAVNPSFFNNFYPVTARKYNSGTHYYIGLIARYQIALLAREIIVERGYKGAFLVAFYNNDEISISKAIEMEQLIFSNAPIKSNFLGNDVQIIMTPSPQVTRDTIAVLDSSKLSDNAYYLDYFYYDFENAIPLNGVNSEAEEILPLVWPGDSIMSFSRAFYNNNTGGQQSGHDVWLAKKEESHYKVDKIAEGIDTKNNDAIVGISKDGERIYLLNSGDDGELKSGLSMVSIQDSEWSEKTNVAIPTLNFKGNFYSLYMHPDEDLLLISMNGADSYGMNDIYLIEKNEIGEWGELIHLDSNINTDGNDISPFITYDKRVFLYSTDGMGGVGGNDLFAVKRKNDTNWNKWSMPQNLGPEINTSNFEGYPQLINNKLYYSSVRDSAFADIYHADLINRMILPIEEYLEMKDTLLFTFNVEEGVLSNANDESLAFESIPVLAMVNTDSRIDMILFDFNKANLKPSFTKFLTNLGAILKDNPDIELDIRGHTDAIGSSTYNYRLGEKRAYSVANYLMAIGIEPERLHVASYGMDVPIASNENEFGRAKNRRVEIRFVNRTR